MTEAIRTDELVKAFGPTRALDGLDLTVSVGEVHGFLGPNGTGKTTTIRILLGLMRADAGTARLLGGDPWTDTTALHRRLAYVPGDVALWPNLSGGEVIDLLGRLRGGLDQPRRAELLERFDLDPRKKGAPTPRATGRRWRWLPLWPPTWSCSCSTNPPRARPADGGRVPSGHPGGTAPRRPDRVAVQPHPVRGRGAVRPGHDHRDGRTVETGTLADLRHLTRTSIEAELSGPSSGLADLPGVHDLRTDNGRVRFDVDSSALEPALRHITAAGVRSLVSHPPTLEELFRRHYDRAGSQ